MAEFHVGKCIVTGVSLDEAASQQVASQAWMQTMTLTPGSPAGKAHQIGFERTKV